MHLSAAPLQAGPSAPLRRPLDVRRATLSALVALGYLIAIGLLLDVALKVFP